MNSAGSQSAITAQRTAGKVPQAAGSITFALIFLNVLVFVVIAWSGGHALRFGGDQVLNWGGNYGPLTLTGQWWRLLSAMFVHIGLLHLAVNMWALYELGALAEEIYGSPTTLLLYLLTGAAGSIASLVRNPLIVSAGASGAIFGLAGALIATLALARLTLRSRGLKIALISLLAFAGYNLTYGFLKGGIDNGAHLGGLVCGLLLGAALSRSVAHGQRTFSIMRLPVVGLAVIILVMAFVGVKRLQGETVALASATKALQTRNPDLAIRTLTQAKPRRKAADFLTLLGAAYLQKKQYDVAASYYQKALQLNPNDFAARNGLGLLLIRSGRLDDARQQLEEAVKLNPKADAAWLELGLLWQRQGNYQNAAACLQRAVDINPNVAPVQFALGISQMSLRQFDAAIAAFQKATLLNPNDYAAQVWLGNAYSAKGMTEQANAAYARAQQLRQAAAARAAQRRRPARGVN
jgi:membrane associated rhomboid family serine protease/Flp pilus assembly protein TadD